MTRKVASSVLAALAFGAIVGVSAFVAGRMWTARLHPWTIVPLWVAVAGVVIAAAFSAQAAAERSPDE